MADGANCVQVTKDTMVGDLLRIDINVVPIFMAIGMNCLGCPASQMETIEEAAMVHGVDANELVDEINDFLKEDEPYRESQVDQG